MGTESRPVWLVRRDIRSWITLLGDARRQSFVGSTDVPRGRSCNGGEEVVVLRGNEDADGELTRAMMASGVLGWRKLVVETRPGLEEVQV